MTEVGISSAVVEDWVEMEVWSEVVVVLVGCSLDGGRELGER